MSQQPVFMQSDWRKPQLVRQVDIEPRSRLLLQAARQVFCSPLHRMGAATATSMQRRQKPNMTAPKRESMSGFMLLPIAQGSLLAFDNQAVSLILR